MTYPVMQCHITEDQNPQQNFKFMYTKLSPLTYCHAVLQKFTVAVIRKLPSDANVTWN
jgi:hypothetical protein